MQMDEMSIDQVHFPLPLMAHFLEAPSRDDDDTTVSETPYETGPDGPPKTDYLDDEDIAGGAPTNTGLIADSDDKEDADYDV